MKGKQTILAAAAIIGTSTLLFQGMVQVVTAANYNKTDTVPTSYAKSVDAPSQTPQNSLPPGYKKTNYTVKAMNNQMPTSKDITKEAAAEIGAKALWEIYALSLEGKVVEMRYQQPREDLPRAQWYGEVIINDKLNYSFMIDAVTGEYFDMFRERTFIEKETYDEELAKNPQEYVDLAKKAAEKYNIVHGPVKSAVYKIQSMVENNDPLMSVEVTGENGEIATVYIARNDKEFIGATYHAKEKYKDHPNAKIYYPKSAEPQK
ncbi:hypothetical protein P4V43_01110 [Brevibacillus fortis]|uniref:PepSY domain-containing protein n=1 Tax=Brevibacillus fortis TaxID=2126352 RepID=A0A2P7V5W3_9BACL|nr:hypothetical protein [Brevibacillus fortis]MED1780419.1 hypothetical protein [Brevibacillus fortis]PSJ94601.1 hypothetical protein C7R93_14525 [Brevibacillus fortis]